MRESLGAVALLALSWTVLLADPKPDPVITVRDPRIVEASGLVARDGDFLAVNDSGDEGRVFVVDGQSGRTVGVTLWSSAPVDVEALAPAGGDDVWVGDIGDNKLERTTVEVTRVPVTRGNRGQAGQTFRLDYPGGPQNAEALLVHPQTGRLYVASKVALGGRLYAAPEELDPVQVNHLEAVGKVGSTVTDGAFFPDGRHLVLRGYGRAIVYSFPDLAVVGSFDLPEQPQGEGIAVSADGEVFVSSEGTKQPVLRVTLPADVRTAMGAAPSTGSPTASPTAGASSSPSGSASPEPGESTAEGSSATPLLVGGGLGAVALAGIAALVVRSRRRT